MKVGLTGGIGSGKSAVAGLLAELGATVVDADALAREVVEPGTPGLAAVVREFGSDVARADGSLDRAALAAVVFADDERRAALEAIIHPLVARRTEDLIAAAPEGTVVVYDVPLLVEKDLAGGYDAVVVVEAPEELRLARLAERGVDPVDARRRMAVQARPEHRLAAADHVIDNSGDLADLAAQVDRLWVILTDQPE